MREFPNKDQRLERLRRSNRRWAKHAKNRRKADSGTNGWKRHTFVLPRTEAREKARELLLKYPKAAYWTEVESWRILDGDVIEFTMRRLPTAD